MAAPLEERFRLVRELFPDYRVGTSGGRIVVRESGTWQHNAIMFRLWHRLLGTVVERGWEIWPNITVYLGEQADQHVPDLAVVPGEPRMHREHAVHGSSALLLAHVVSEGSAYDDYHVKPGGYSPAGVPLYLVVDAIHGMCTLFSEPGPKRYGRETVASACEPLFLPAPWELTLYPGELWRAAGGREGE